MLELALSGASPETSKTCAHPQILKLVYGVSFGQQDNAKIQHSLNK